MLRNGKPSTPSPRRFLTPKADARRLRHEYNRLQRQLGAMDDVDSDAAKIGGLKAQIDRVVRDLSQVRADSVHAVEVKLRVALDQRSGGVDPATQRLLSSVLSDLHYLVMLTPTPH